MASESSYLLNSKEAASGGVKFTERLVSSKWDAVVLDGRCTEGS